MNEVKRLETENLIDETDAPGTPAQRRRKLPGEEPAPAVPKTSGAPADEPDTSRSPVANRNSEGPRQAGVSPRPTDKPGV